MNPVSPLNFSLQSAQSLSSIDNSLLSTTNSPNQAQVKVLNLLFQSKFKIYLAEAQNSLQKFALKVFPQQNDGLHPSYKSEKRLWDIKHPNIVNQIASQDSLMLESPSKNQSPATASGLNSCILYELAPYGSLQELVFESPQLMNETLIRTFFQDLVNGVQYLHSMGIAHLDLKAENLVLGEDWNVKICDFDGCFVDQLDQAINSNGTVNQRAPEIADQECNDPFKADIFSLGIILFEFVVGHLPFTEDIPMFWDLFQKEKEKFWELHQKLSMSDKIFEEDFKNLFESMVCLDPNERVSIDEIKSFGWYAKEILKKEDIKNLLEDNIQKIK